MFMRRIFAIACLFSCSAASCAEIYKNDIALSELVYTIRDPATQAREFRYSLKKIGEMLGREVLQQLPVKMEAIETCLGASACHPRIAEQPVLLTILRAGLPLFFGVQKIFPNAESGFIAMARDEETLLPKREYVGIPEIKGKTVIVIDTMIATGGSMLDALELIKKQEPKNIIVIGAIGSKVGLEKVQEFDPSIAIYCAAVDDSLNEKGYIVPGLGDAGDRSFGKKLEVK